MRFYYIIFLIFLATQTNVFSQVGIGNTDPDPSSILDITSSTQGMLTPRMTTAQRTAITTPAQGLLVFDTDLNAFYFYDSTLSDWRKMITDSVERDNYVLVKSVADLPAESGGVITLDENTYYEINGEITLAFPIDLNDAYISGLDANEDKLIAATGNIFSGSNGGSVRNLSLEATTGSIFSLSGSLTQTLLFQNCIVSSSSSVGSITSFGLVFMNIIQFVGNTDGITFTSGGNILLSNLGWFGNNTGTFETYTGTFGLIEKVSGFSNVPTGAIGIDVSSNPTVTNGVISSTPFTGAGTYVDGYTTGSYVGFDFSNVWDVNCPGLKVENDDSAAGDFYFSGSLTSGFGQTISDPAEEIDGGTFASNRLFRFSVPTGQGNNRLVYDGLATRQFQVSASLSIRISSALNNFFAVVIYKNGIEVTESNALVYIDATNGDTQIQNVAISAIVELSTNDYIEIYIDRLTGTSNDNLSVFSEVLTIK